MATRLPPVRLGILISGTGTNLQAIIDAIAQGRLQAEIRLVVSNRASAPGLQRAQAAGLRTMVIDHRAFASRQAFDWRMRQALEEAAVELVILAGFMRLLSPVMLQGFPDRIMNIHPALLPAFPGLDVQRAAIDHGARFSGCTVFFVREGIDDGPIIIQAVVPVYPTDSPADLAHRIQLQEHRIYPRAIALFQQKRLQISGRRVLIKDWDTSNAGAALINPESD
jgi:phosphoribosylglycinamide formyltransferase-1